MVLRVIDCNAVHGIALQGKGEIMGSMLHGFLIAGLILSGFACTNSFQGEYDDPSKREIVDDKWNESDYKKTAETMIGEMISKPWLENYKRKHNGQAPVVVVDDVENRTDEHIDWKAMTEFIQDELINSGKVRFVNKERRKAILEEVKYQNSGEVRKSTSTERGGQTGADYFLGGAISSSVHTQEGLKTVHYQTNLTLTDLETAEIVWSGKQLIKKRFNRSGSSW